MKRSISANDTVTLEMSRKELDELLVILGFAAAAAIQDNSRFAQACIRFSSDLIDAD